MTPFTPAPIRTGAATRVQPPLVYPPIPLTYIAPNELTSPKFGMAFAHGCEGLISARYTVPPVSQPIAAFATPPTWPLFDGAIACGQTYYYGDHGYYGRGQYYRVGKNAPQLIPSADDLLTATPSRFESLTMNAHERWQPARSGQHILICPHSDVYHARQTGGSASDWVAAVVDQLKPVTDRPIRIRTKSMSAVRPIYEDLADCWMVIVYSSNSAVDALRSGVPICTLAPWASTRNMGVTDVAHVEQPYRPDDRLAFLWWLATAQWSLPELAAGDAWRWLRER